MPSPPDIVLYTKRWCAYCTLAKDLLERRGLPYRAIDVSEDAEKRAWLVATTGKKKLPQIFIDGRAIGGFAELRDLDREGRLVPER